MGVLVTFIDFQFGHQDPTKAVLGDHSANGMGDELLGVTSADLFD